MTDGRRPDVDVRRVADVAVEPLGEFVRIGLETSDGSRLLLRMPTGELRLAIPHLLALPGRAEAEADPIGSPRPTPGGPGRVRAVPAHAAAIRLDTGTDLVLLELHVGSPSYPVFFSFPRERMRELVARAFRRMTGSP